MASYRRPHPGKNRGDVIVIGCPNINCDDYTGCTLTKQFTNLDTGNEVYSSECLDCGHTFYTSIVYENNPIS